jgi:hypothetical protein
MHRRSYYRTRSASRPDLQPDRVAIPGGVLRRLVDIHAHYDAQGEQVVGIVICENDRDRFEATVMGAARTLFHVKLRVSEQGVHEFGRAESA